MAYEPNNLALAYAPVGGLAPRVFTYKTTNDSDATITGAGYFADGVIKGMRAADLVQVIATTGPKYKLYQVASVSGVAATVAAPTAIA
jgi:hypothetical protein